VATQHVPSLGPVVPEGTRVLQVTGNPEHAAQAAGGDRFIAPVGVSLRDLVMALRDRPRRRLSPPLRSPAPSPDTHSEGALAPEYVLATLATLLPDDAVIVEETPTHRNAIHAHLPVRALQDYYVAASGGLG
jgi:benzoylformate decarboxylase